MQFKVFTVYDSKAEAYLPPFYMGTQGQALRAFADSANDPNHSFYKHPEDYTLFLLGVFDDSNARFDLAKNHTPMGKAIEVRMVRELPLGGKLIDTKGAVA